MTFYEAAVEVLRSAGRPLHVKKITQISIGQNLLTHVGRDPEKTMAARLAQEIAKANGDSLIRSVRPHVYALRDGADPSDAKQTVQLRSFDDVKDHMIAKPVATNGSANGAAAESDDDEQSRSRGRGRRANRNEASQDTAAHSPRESRSAKEERSATDVQPTRHTQNARRSKPERSNEERPRQESQTASRQPRAPRSLNNASPAAQKLAQLQQEGTPTREAGGDLALHIANVLRAENRELNLSEISEALQGTAYAHLPELPSAALKTTFALANERRAQAGQPPLFRACPQERWALVDDTDETAQSYAALQAWKEQHYAQLTRRLERVIAERSDEEILGIVALVMEREGYTNLTLHPAEGNELATFSARHAHGLSEERVAVRVFGTTVPITRLDIMAFRGNLHQYEAARGIIFTLGGHSLCAREQTQVPNVAPIDLLHDGKLAELMIRTQVGTTSVHIAVPSLDDAFFA